MTLKGDRDFEVAPRLLEEEYTLADAVVVGTLLQSILAHADSCRSQHSPNSST